MMQSKNFYPVYKEIESNLISQFPNHWLWSKLKYVANLSGRIGFRGYTVNDIVDEGNGAITLSPSNIIDGEMSLNKKTYISWEKYYESPEIMIKENDILFCKTGSSYGKSAIVERLIEPMTINPQLVVIKPKDNISPAFLAYLMESSFIKDQVELIVGGGTMPTISQEDLLAMNVLLPSKSEQKTIVDYLNKKCFEVNELIQTKLRLINLLEEKRQAIITEAVTKGLNPNVKMKDSGVEWIGEIPEHWDVIKAKYIFNEKSVKGYPEKRLLSVSKGKGVIPRDEMEFKVVMAFKDLQNFKLVQFEDFVIHLRSFQSGFEMSKIEGIVSPAYTIFSLKNVGVANYYKYVFYSKVFINAVGSTTQSLRDGKPIAYNDFGNMEIMVPSLREQYEIAQYIEENLKTIDDLIVNIRFSIEKLKEYRQSLIYEAVTGKIDVRDIEIDS